MMTAIQKKKHLEQKRGTSSVVLVPLVIPDVVPPLPEFTTEVSEQLQDIYSILSNSKEGKEKY